MEATGENSSIPIVRWNAINKTLKKIYYIIDTNVLLDFKDLLLDIAGKVCDKYQLTVIIPYAAINELDGLKKSTSINISKVQNTIKWCNKYIEANISWIKGQTYEHFKEANKYYDGVDADEKICNCALLYMKDGNSVALITNDINLKNRAILSGVKAHTVQQLYQILENAMFVVGNFVVDMENSSSTANKAISNHFYAGAGNNDNLSSYLNNIRTSIAHSLGDILRTVMISTYGDLWEQIILIKPPWSSRTVLKCFRKHWIAVFSDKLPRKINIAIENVSKDLENIPVMPSLSEVDSLAKKVLDMYDLFKRTEFAGSILTFVLRSDPSKEVEQAAQCHIVCHALNNIGTCSNAIFLHNKKSFDDLSENSFNNENAITVIDGLTNLQSTLISLGDIIMRFADAPTLSGCSDIQIQIKSFWKSAQSCDKDTSISDLEYMNYFSTNESKEFLKHYLNDLETVINKIQEALLTMIN